MLPLCFLVCLVGSKLYASELNQWAGPRLTGLRLESIPEATLVGALVAPLTDTIDYVGRLGDTGTPYLLLWLCVLFAIRVGSSRSAGARNSLLARFTLFFLFSVQVIFLGLYLSSFYGRSQKLIVQPKSSPVGASPIVVGDFHCHSYLSTGFLNAQQLVEWHRRRGYNAMSITDSNRITASVEAQEYARKRYPDFHVVVGEEYKQGKSGVHLVLLGIKSEIRPEHFTPEKAVEETHRQGGLAIVAHPWSVGGMTLEQMAALGVDGFEVFNGVMVGSEELRSLCVERNLVALGATDLKKGPDTHVWNVYPVTPKDWRAKQPEESDYLTSMTDRRNAVVTCMEGEPVEGFRNPGWKPPANLLTPFAGIGRMVLSMTVARGVSWVCWLSLLWFCVRKCREIARHRADTKPSSEKETGPTAARAAGILMLLLASLGILLCGASTAAFKLKEIYTLTMGQCIVCWIVLDWIALRGLRRIYLR